MSKAILQTRRTRLLAGFYLDMLGGRTIITAVVCAVLISLFELTGLALVFPFIRLVVDPAFVAAVRGWAQFHVDLNLPASDRGLILLSAAAMLIFYSAKGVIHTLLIRHQAHVAARLNEIGSRHIIDSALRARYQLFMDHGGVKIAAVSYSNTTHAALLFQSLVAGLNEALLLACVFAGALFISVPGTLVVVCLLGIVGVLVFMPVSRRVAAIGRETQALDLARHRFVFAMAQAVKDIKIMGLEAPFMRRNALVVRQHVLLSAAYQWIGSALRIFVEFLLVAGIVGAGLWFAFSAARLEEAAALMAALGMAAVRTAPALSRLASAYNGFRYSLPFVDGLFELNAEISRYPQPRLPDGARLPAEYAMYGVDFSYGAHQVLKGVSMTIPAGAVVGVVGPSGAGKSTLLDVLAGLVPATAGSFALDGKPFVPFESADFPRQVGYVPQSISLLDASLAYNIALEDEPDAERLSWAIERAHLADLVKGLPKGAATLMGEGGIGVSGGQRQRIGIARALYRRPHLLILDEVTSSLDEATEADVMRDLLALRGAISLLIVTHRPRTVCTADIIYRIDAGALVDVTRTLRMNEETVPTGGRR